METERFRKEFRNRYGFTLTNIQYGDIETGGTDMIAAVNSETGETLQIEVKTLNKPFSRWRKFAEAGSKSYVFAPSTSAITWDELHRYTFPPEDKIEKHKGFVPDYIKDKQCYVLNASVRGSKHLGISDSGEIKSKWIKLLERDNTALIFIFSDCIIHFSREELEDAFLCYAYIKPSNSKGGYELKAMIDYGKGFRYQCNMPSEYFPPKDGYK